MEAKAKTRLYHLVDLIPDAEIHAAERYLDYLAEHGDPFVRRLVDAPFDGEAVTDQEEAGVQEAWGDYKAGRVHTLDEVKEELGL